MSNKLYDVLKWVAILLLPALATFISVVFNIWGLPYGDAIAQTITALDIPRSNSRNIECSVQEEQ